MAVKNNAYQAAKPLDTICDISLFVNAFLGIWWRLVYNEWIIISDIFAKSSLVVQVLYKVNAKLLVEAVSNVNRAFAEFRQIKRNALSVRFIDNVQQCVVYKHCNSISYPLEFQCEFFVNIEFMSHIFHWDVIWNVTAYIPQIQIWKYP